MGEAEWVRQGGGGREWVRQNCGGREWVRQGGGGRVGTITETPDKEEETGSSWGGEALEWLVDGTVEEKKKWMRGLREPG
ncbi:hypothetical protein Pcinc_040341 [Petrolisthes cinctipes]|uniref:Uncharacterized protein n=1 Tax=Petrolisthes cinctipes TaxID=88211 RepID=A0AAE1BLT3_PETCI|nr:hypothetical protein Pcinc_040341 [Petrolisthes cinctipes]